MNSKIAYAGLLALCMMLVTVPGVAADDVAGASGQCEDADDADDYGGSAYLAVGDDGSVDEQGVSDGTLVFALAELADGEGDITAGDGCTAEDGVDRDEDGDTDEDYLEVHVAGNQVCYNGDVQTDGSCATRP